MRILITGATGFVGGHLIEMLCNQSGVVLFGVARHPENLLPKLQPHVTLISADLRRPEAVTRLLDHVRPDQIYHLAGQAFVPAAWEEPWTSFELNVRPQLNLLKSMVELGLEARMLCVGSSKAYGRISPEENPVPESHPLFPDNPYGVSKAAQELVAYQYFLSHGLPVIRVRPFNHHGPRQNPSFVAASFARQIAQAEVGLREPVVRVGNLDAERDFSDIVDVVRAYVALMERGTPGEVYNVGSGRAHRVQAVLDTLRQLSQVTITVERDPDRLRPADKSVGYADITKIREETGWSPEISFEESLRKILNYWRREVGENVRHEAR